MPHRNQKIFDEGWQAWTDGALISENPYINDDSNNWAAWQDGWCAAQEDYEDTRREDDDYSAKADWEYDRNR